MPRKTKDGQPFDQQKYVNNWAKQNMKSVSAQYKAEFVTEYKEALKKLGLKNSDMIRTMMQEIIAKAKEIEE